jgi:hypothetical protein
MHMLMMVFRSSLKERIHAFLEQCGVRAYTELPETVGTGQTGPAEGLSYYPGVNTVLLVAVEETVLKQVEQAVKAWVDQVLRLPSGEKPSIRLFSWPCRQLL